MNVIIEDSEITDNETVALSHPTCKQICMFLSDYAAWLLGCGATCIRLEKNVNRIAHTFDKNVDMCIMPRHINLTVSSKDRLTSFTAISSIRCKCINFDMNTRLSRLSWEVADGRLNFEQTKKGFENIINTPTANKWMVLFLASVANASFCRLFGGDIPAMIIVFIATLAGFYLKQILTENKIDIRIIFIVCSFVSSVFGATDNLFSIGSTPEIAIGTGVVYLVPWLPLRNSFSDMLARHYICAFSRFMDALILTACLSIGLCGGMVMMNIGMF